MKQPGKLIVLFDFDKTLTYNDTLIDFFTFVSNRKNLYLRGKVAYVLKVISWLGLMNNTKLKTLLTRLYLRKVLYSEVVEKSRRFAETIVFNKVYYDCFHTYKDEQYIVVSASFQEFLQFIIPSKNLLASSLAYNDEGIVTGVRENYYGADKVKGLRSMGIINADIFYTDSYSDKPVMDISDSVFLVKHDTVQRIK
jgi:phosphoserine phosphatase